MCIYIERERDTYTYIYIYIYIHTYIIYPVCVLRADLHAVRPLEVSVLGTSSQLDKKHSSGEECALEC